MMHQQGGYLYYEGDGFQALDLPYKGGQLSMLVVLPRKKDGLASLERQWAGGSTYRQVTDGLDHEETVIVSLPRFKMETEFRLKPVLCDLGAELAFSDEADFSGIGEEPLKISEVVHKAFVEVNEEGTEAAAATAVGMVLCAGRQAAPRAESLQGRPSLPVLHPGQEDQRRAVLRACTRSEVHPQEEATVAPAFFEIAEQGSGEICEILNGMNHAERKVNDKT